jgi:hypothetical protein
LAISDTVAIITANISIFVIKNKFINLFNDKILFNSILFGLKCNHYIST